MDFRDKTALDARVSSNDPVKADWSDSLGELLAPGMAGLSGRMAVMGAKGELHLDANALKRQLGKMESPVAQELVKRMDTMQSEGWQFLKAGAEAHAGVYQQNMRRVFFQQQGSTLSHMIGVDLNPAKQSAPILAHEVAHHNGVLFYGTEGLSQNDQKIMSLRKIEAETTSMLAETHIADELGVKDVRPWNVSTEPRRAAIASGELGQYIIDTHGSKYFKVNPDSQWVKTQVNDFIDTTYGGSMINNANGKVRAFDLNAGYGRNIAELEFDKDAKFAWRANDFVGERIKYPDADLRSELGKALRSGESQTMSQAAHVSKGLAAFGFLLAANDLPGAFENGMGSGVGRLAKVGVDYAGYSVGASAANSILAKAGDLALHYPKLGTAAVLVAGFASAYLADQAIGKNVEKTVAQNLRSR
ncbi:MAG: hypothetical protein K2X81_22060 [Candidatus Obscuribacterales bacterium]|nr:hypothetical protein [Candidatus Obscuribacterales bacterium]